MRKLASLAAGATALLLCNCGFGETKFSNVTCHPKPFSMDNFPFPKEPFLELDCGGMLVREVTTLITPRIYYPKEILRLKDKPVLLCAWADSPEPKCEPVDKK